MDFIMGFPMIARKHDLIMVEVNKFSKETNFILVKSTHNTSDIPRIFMKKIFKLHEIPKYIILDHGTKFTSIFWKGLFQDLGIN
jgi:hypothetical protein